jgi:hypothetical protein
VKNDSILTSHNISHLLGKLKKDLRFKTCHSTIMESKSQNKKRDSFLNHSSNTQTNDYGEMDVSLQSYLKHDYSYGKSLTLEEIHEIILQRFKRFHPNCSSLKTLDLGDYIFTLNQMELGIKNLRNYDNAQRLLLSTTVHKVRHNELDQRQKKKGGGNRYKLLTTMMRFNTELDRTGYGGQISSIDGRFIYFRHADVRILNEEKFFHALVENFILKAFEMERDFDRIDK